MDEINFELISNEYKKTLKYKTKKESIEAVKRNGDALQYVKIVNNNDDEIELTIKKICSYFNKKVNDFFTYL